jgi:hypothetical protein
MFRRGPILKIAVLLFSLFTLSAMSSCQNQSGQGQSSNANQSGDAADGGGGDSSGGGGGGY